MGQFLKGVGSFLKAMTWLLSHKRVSFLAYIPVWFSFIALIFALIYGTQHILDLGQFFSKQFFDQENIDNLFFIWKWMMLGLIFIIVISTAGLLALVLFQVLASPIYEIVSQRVEKDITGKVDEVFDLRTIIRVVFTELKKMSLVALISIGLIFIPFGHTIAPFFTAFCLAWDAFDYPLARKGLSFNTRLFILRSNVFAVMGLSVWLLIPIFNFLLMPIAIVAGTLLHFDKAASSQKGPL